VIIGDRLAVSGRNRVRNETSAGGLIAGKPGKQTIQRLKDVIQLSQGDVGLVVKNTQTNIDHI
jgi:hypothetical protein